MKYKNKYDIGDRVHCIFTKDVLEIIQVMSRNIYFQLNYKFQKDRTLIKETIKAFKKHKRIDEINIRFKPLKKRNHKVNDY